MKKFLIGLSIFSFGYLFSDICRELGFSLSEKAYAYEQLFSKRDIERIIERCTVDGFDVDGYVSMDDYYFSTYVSDRSISC